MNEETITLKYFIADGARMNTKINDFSVYNANPHSVFSGTDDEPISEVGPFLVEVAGNKSVIEWLLNEGKGDSWGVFFNSNADFKTLFAHLQKLVTVVDEEGREMYFRYYDPRVIKLFLPTCDEKQLSEFFGPITEFYAEDLNGDQYLTFSLTGNKLVTRSFSITNESDNIIKNERFKKETNDFNFDDPITIV